MVDEGEARQARGARGDVMVSILHRIWHLSQPIRCPDDGDSPTSTERGLDDAGEAFSPSIVRKGLVVSLGKSLWRVPGKLVMVQEPKLTALREALHDGIWSGLGAV